MNTQKSTRTRNYTFVCYPESAPENWRDVIDEHHVAWSCSPLHDSDVNADGTPKKAHWHVMIAFDSVKTLDQANLISASVNATVCQPVESPRALIRYFAHMDNPEKHQYDRRLIEAHGGIDLDDMLRTSNRTKYDALRDMIQYCIDADVTEYEDLMIYAMNNEPEWFEALADNCTYAISAFLKSRRHRREQA